MVGSGKTLISRSQRLLVAIALGLLGTPAFPCDFCSGGASDFTPFQDLVEKRKPELDAELLARWAVDKRTPPASRGILILLLGVCAGEPQVRQMAAWIDDPQWQQRSGYDALIAAYWLRRGPAGLAEVQAIIEKIDAGDRPPPAKAFLRALRFHENQKTPITKEQTLDALRDLLRYPEAVDLTLFELNRRNDWASLPAIIELHREHRASRARLAGPVRDYLRACPKPEAQAFLKKIEEPK